MALPAPAQAGSFRLSPIPVTIDGLDKATHFRIENLGDEEVVVQIQAKAWAQDQGQDRFQETDELIFFPRIVTVPAREQVVVRVGYSGSEPTASERSFRLFAEELPVSADQTAPLKLTLRLSVPLFVRPGRAEPKATLEELQVDGGELLVAVRNTGTVHLQLGSIELVGSSAEGERLFTEESPGWYVLPGAARTFRVPIPPESCARTATLEVAAHAGSLLLEGRRSVEPGVCDG